MYNYGQLCKINGQLETTHKYMISLLEVGFHKARKWNHHNRKKELTNVMKSKVIHLKRRRELQNFANNAARQFLTGVSNKKSILLSILDLRIT